MDLIQLNTTLTSLNREICKNRNFGISHSKSSRSTFFELAFFKKSVLKSFNSIYLGNCFLYKNITFFMLKSAFYSILLLVSSVHLKTTLFRKKMNDLTNSATLRVCIWLKSRDSKIGSIFIIKMPIFWINTFWNLES